MAHYDCSDCGSSMGIAFGYCNSCTPKEYKDAQHELNKIAAEAEVEWSNQTYLLKRQFLKAYKKEQRETIEQLQAQLKPK